MTLQSQINLDDLWNSLPSEQPAQEETQEKINSSATNLDELWNSIPSQGPSQIPGQLGDEVLNAAKGVPVGIVKGTADLGSTAYNLAVGAHNTNIERSIDADPREGAMMESIGATNPIIGNVTKENAQSLKMDEARYLGEELEKALGARRNIAYSAIETASSILGPGALTHLFEKVGAKATAKAISFFGKLSKKELTSAAVMGGVQEGTKDYLGDLGALGLGAVSGSLARTKSLGTQVKGGMVGVRPENINLETVRKFKNVGVDTVPLASITNSKMASYFNKKLRSNKDFRDEMKGAVQEGEQEFVQSLDKFVDSLGLPKNEESKKTINNLYKKPREMAKGDVWVARGLDDKIINLVEDLSNNLLGDSDPNNAAIKVLGDLSDSIFRENGVVSINKLVNTKQGLNDLINWEKTSSLSSLKTVVRDINEAIADYGKTNHKFWESYKKAENTFERMSKREKVESLVANKIKDSSGELKKDIKFESLIDVLSSHKSKDVLERNLTSDQLKSVREFVNVGRTLVDAYKGKGASSKSNFLVANLKNILYSPYSFVMSKLGGQAYSDLMTDKDFREKMIRFRENPETFESLAESFKKITGLTLQQANSRLIANKET